MQPSFQIHVWSWKESVREELDKAFAFHNFCFSEFYLSLFKLQKFGSLILDYLLHYSSESIILGMCDTLSVVILKKKTVSVSSSGFS